MNERTGYITPPPPPPPLIDNWQFIIKNKNRCPLFHLIINTYNIILNYEFLIHNYMEIYNEKSNFNSI